MTKTDILTKIPQETGIEKKAILETVEAFMETVKESMIDSEGVYHKIL